MVHVPKKLIGKGETFTNHQFWRSILPFSGVKTSSRFGVTGDGGKIVLGSIQSVHSLDASRGRQISSNCSNWYQANRLCSWVCLGMTSIHTVDGGNPAPVDIVNIPLSTGFYTSQVVQDFFHQQYHHCRY